MDCFSSRDSFYLNIDEWIQQEKYAKLPNESGIEQE